MIKKEIKNFILFYLLFVIYFLVSRRVGRFFIFRFF